LLANTDDYMSYAGFSCPKGYVFTELIEFGLGLKNEKCMGSGLESKVKTLDRCTIGIMNNE